jgi:hypothetical protein
MRHLTYLGHDVAVFLSVVCTLHNFFRLLFLDILVAHKLPLLFVFICELLDQRLELVNKRL